MIFTKLKHTKHTIITWYTFEDLKRWNGWILWLVR